MKVRLTARAQRDLRAIGDYIAQDSPEIATRFVDELQAKVLGVGDLPYGFPVAGRWRGFPVRKRTHGNHLIFYYVARGGVTILRILHGFRDYSKLYQ